MELTKSTSIVLTTQFLLFHRETSPLTGSSLGGGLLRVYRDKFCNLKAALLWEIANPFTM
jgi:hypothetical protein